MSSSSNSILAFIAGIAVGAGVTIFLQSEKGKEIRGIVSNYLEEKGIKLSKEDFDSLVSSVLRRTNNEIEAQ